MRKLFVLALCLFALACKKSASSLITTSLEPHWIPNLYNGDLLRSRLIDTMGNQIGWDSIYTQTIGDTSCLIYHGTKLYIWMQPVVKTGYSDTFEANKQSYIDCFINTIPFDTTGSWSGHGLVCSVMPSKYLNNGNWQHQPQSVITNNNGHYMSHCEGIFVSPIVH